METDWAIVIAAIAAAVGTTGVAGLLTGGLQLSRSSRLRRSIGASMELRKALRENSASDQALSTAIDADTLRLAAMSLVRAPTLLVRLIIPMIVMLVILAGTSWVALGALDQEQEAFNGRYPLGLIALGYFGVLLGAATAQIWVIDSSTRSRRERFVRAALAGGGGDWAAVLTHDFRANHTDDANSLKRQKLVVEALRKSGVMPVEEQPRRRSLFGRRK
jgi:hypothetical protein